MSPESSPNKSRKQKEAKMSPLVLRLVEVQESNPELLDIVNYVANKYTRPEITTLHHDPSGELFREALNYCRSSGKMKKSDEPEQLLTDAVSYLIRARGL